MSPSERENVIQARIDGFNYGYDEAVSNITKKLQAMHDEEFGKLAALFKEKTTDELMLKLACKTHEVIQLEKVLEVLEDMK